MKAIGAKNSVNTRIFTFGVGDDVNAAMLDQLADRLSSAHNQYSELGVVVRGDGEGLAARPHKARARY